MCLWGAQGGRQSGLGSRRGTPGILVAGTQQDSAEHAPGLPVFPTLGVKASKMLKKSKIQDTSIG